MWLMAKLVFAAFWATKSIKIESGTDIPYISRTLISVVLEEKVLGYFFNVYIFWGKTAIGLPAYNYYIIARYCYHLFS